MLRLHAYAQRSSALLKREEKRCRVLRVLLTRSLSESTDCVMSLYLGTSAKSLSYVGCRAQHASDLLHTSAWAMQAVQGV